MAAQEGVEELADMLESPFGIGHEKDAQEGMDDEQENMPNATLIEVDAQENMPEGVHHFVDGYQVPRDIKKYWQQRHKIFSNYDKGIWMTDIAWYSVTPEPVATVIAAHVATAPADKEVIIDLFCGVGANTIAFANSGRWKQVFAIEKDEKTIQCAKHNAEIYGAKGIIWHTGDAFEKLKTNMKYYKNKAVIFASPPWGGPCYRDLEVFDLESMPYSLTQLYQPFSAYTEHVILYLPRTSDLRQIAKLAKPDEKLEVVHYCMWGASKAICVYFGRYDQLP